MHGTENKLTTVQWDSLIQRVLDEGKSDFDVYSLAREKALGSTLAADLQAVVIAQPGDESAHLAGDKADEEGGDGRAVHMVNMTAECIPAALRSGIGALLDYGCAEGAITAELGRKLMLPAHKVFGADVRSIPSVGFTFLPLQAEDSKVQPRLGSILPSLRDGSVDLVTAAMVFHHVTHVSAILLELRRVISPKGVLVIREHHCVSRDGGAFLDIIHGLYSLSWSAPIEWPDFLSEYKAFYRSREEWDALICAAGFVHISHSSPEAARHYRSAERSVPRGDGKIPNVIKAYYAVYAPDPLFVLPAATAYSESAKRSHTATSQDDSASKKQKVDPPPATDESQQVFESRKYPGRFYRIDAVTGATVWV